jgi:hypothetical protein
VPKRVIDFDAMWGSDKLASCAEWAQAEYAWLYGLADACGCFEMTNLRVIWGRVAAVRRNLTIERLEQVFLELQDKGLLFVWEHEGKRYAHWTGSDVPGRLPPPSWRMRLERFAPPVPKQRLAEYMARFARGRAALASTGFGSAGRCQAERTGNFKFEISDLKEDPEARGRQRDLEWAAAHRAGGRRAVGAGIDIETGLKEQVESAQGQDLGLDLEESRDREGELRRDAAGHGRGLNDAGDRPDDGVERGEAIQAHFWDSNPRSSLDSNSISESGSNAPSSASVNRVAATDPRVCSRVSPRAQGNVPPEIALDNRRDTRGMSAKELATERELRVGQGPVCSPKGVKPEVIERDRLRQLAQAKAL